MKEKLIYITRWIAVLPASIIGSFIAYGIGMLINRWAAGFIYIDEDINVVELLTEIVLGGVISGGAFVSIGCETAPKYKKAVGVILCIIISSICLVSMVYSVNLYGFIWQSIKISIQCIACIVTAVVVCNKYYKEQY